MALDVSLRIKARKSFAHSLAAHSKLAAQLVLRGKSVARRKSIGEPANQQAADLQVARKRVEEIRPGVA